ncbi:MAG: alpha-amylase family protein [Bacteroidetes bacterium]|nr:alpha-amylase family protein [Bacteroidota bacterium]MBS1979640.1 alpha-amylase family protein [Bacteroidota bacterium]
MQTQSKKIIIYQMMTRLFGNTNSTNKQYGTIEENGVGKFNDITDQALKGIKELGASHVWYTGVIEHAVLTDYTKYGILLDDADVVKGRAGSPYAIKDYYDVNPDLAVNVPQRMTEFEQLVDRTHHNGLKVIIDFVPNHVARAYHSDAKPIEVKDLGENDDKSVGFKPSNNFYYLPGQSFHSPQNYVALGNQNSFLTKDGKFTETPAKASGNDLFTATPGINDWFETVKINYGVDVLNGRKTYFDPVPDTWIKMKDILIFWANKKIDGFRCDMAEMVPVEFWNWAIPQVKQINSQLIFIAEIYNPQQYRNYIDIGKFDFLYDKVQLYDQLRLLINQKGQTTELPKIQESLKGINHKMVHFLENHDEQRIASSFFAGDAWKAIPAMTVSALIDQSPVMIYFGQEVGEAGAGTEGFSGEDGRTTIFDYWGVPAHQAWMNGGKFNEEKLTDDQKQLRQFYGDMLNFASTDRAIVEGSYFDLTQLNIEKKNMSQLVHAFIRSRDEDNLLIVTNFNISLEKIKLQLSEEAIAAMQLKKEIKYIGRDLLRSGTDIGFDHNFMTEIELPPHSAFIFKIKS